MINIKKSEIRALLSAYDHESGRKNKTDLTLIDALSALLDPPLNETDSKPKSPSDHVNDDLTQEELYTLAIALLTRERSPRLFSKLKKSDALAKTLEDKFGNGIFESLSNEFDENNGHLTQRQFNKIIAGSEELGNQANLNTIAQPNVPSDPAPREISLESAIDDNLFSQLDGRIIRKIAKLSFSGAMSLSLTCKSVNTLFSVNKKISEQIEKKRDLLRQLLGHVALGELAPAETIWREHPDLLTRYGTIFHPNRIYNGDESVVDIPFHHNPGRYRYLDKTPLQILWMNEEFEDAKLIEELLNPEEVARQFFEVFPDGVIKKDNFDLEKSKKLLQSVFDAIIKDSSINANDLDVMNAETREALNQLYGYAKPKSDHGKGLVFDANFYLAALTLYDGESNKSFKHNSGKYDFWCIRVEEWLAGCLGTGYLRPHAQGLGSAVSRQVGCNLQDGSSAFSFRLGAQSLPGLNFFVGFYGWRTLMARGAFQNAFQSAAFTKLCQTKSNAARDLCKRATQTLKQNVRP